MSTVIGNAQTNGVIKISRRGIAKIEFVEGESFEVDVVAVYDAWYEIDWALRDEKGELPNNKQNEHGNNRLQFVQTVVNQAYQASGKTPPVLTRGEAEAFVNVIIEEVKKLRNFSGAKPGEQASSPGSTETRFSQ